jgi:hypothetical protein
LRVVCNAFSFAEPGKEEFDVEAAGDTLEKWWWCIPVLSAQGMFDV